MGFFNMKIVRTTIIDTDSRKSAASSIGRGIVGGFFLGGAGMFGGAMSGKNKKTTTFLIEYEDGKQKVETVKNGSMSYNLYIKFLNK